MAALFHCCFDLQVRSWTLQPKALSGSQHLALRSSRCRRHSGIATGPL
jgi:hypothetical protein